MSVGDLTPTMAPTPAQYILPADTPEAMVGLYVSAAFFLVVAVVAGFFCWRHYTRKKHAREARSKRVVTARGMSQKGQKVSQDPDNNGNKGEEVGNKDKSASASAYDEESRPPDSVQWGDTGKDPFKRTIHSGRSAVKVASKGVKELAPIEGANNGTRSPSPTKGDAITMLAAGKHDDDDDSKKKSRSIKRRFGGQTSGKVKVGQVAPEPELRALPPILAAGGTGSGREVVSFTKKNEKKKHEEKPTTTTTTTSRFKRLGL